jgi:hypothetical protein
MPGSGSTGAIVARATGCHGGLIPGTEAWSAALSWGVRAREPATGSWRLTTIGHVILALNPPSRAAGRVPHGL